MHINYNWPLTFTLALCNLTAVYTYFNRTLHFLHPCMCFALVVVLKLALGNYSIFAQLN